MANTEKLFTVVGTATKNGNTKVRFANDLVARVKILAKSGFTDINLLELPKAMTKLEALQYLQAQTLSGDAAYAVANKVAEKSKLAKRGEVKAVKEKPSLEKIRARALNTAPVDVADGELAG